MWNTASGQFEYLTAVQSGNDSTGTHARGACKWTVETMESFDKTVDMTGTTARIFAASAATGETITDKDGYTAKPYKGLVKDAAGNALAEYIGVKTGINTWKDLSAVKDTDNWYHYGAEYLNADKTTKVTGSTLSFADLQQTENLVFTARNASTNIIVEEDTDLGIGYVRLGKADGLPRASYTISGSHLLNSAGYIVDSGVDAHLQLTNSANYMREWRAVVENNATLHIEGAGDTNALLNVGGQGTVYLNRTSGYSGYNVLANNGITVIISDIGQIKRDFTFGYHGGVLDMNGQSMTWNNANAASAAGFTIHALDEQAIIANRAAGTTTTLTWTQAGGQTWLGSFQDTANSALKFVYNGGGVLTMNSIHTNLQNAGSGMEVQSGKVVLVGTNTIHGKGSESGRNANRYFSAEDWHYADTTANVSVQNGGTFELGSHARLTGNVAVANGGNLIIREGVKHQYEHIEGGQVLEDTDDIRDFYGLKGNIVNNGTLTFAYSAGTDSTNIYEGAISGTGSMGIDLGTAGAKLVLSGANTMSGAHTVTSGGVVLKNSAALGSVTGANAWKIGEQAWLGVEGVTDSATLLSHIHADSTGSLALGGNLSNIDMSGHTGLFLGAEEGMKVQLGTLGTTDTLTAWHTADGHKQWLLGGGGGELVVNLKLTGDSDLVLGNPHMGGTVTLTNTANDFTGTIVFTEGSNVVLNFTDPRALGSATVDLAYGKALGGGADAATTLAGTINEGAEGVMLLDDDTDAVLNMSARPTVHLGANGQNVSFTGNITVAHNGTYYFGGPGRLILQNALATNGTNNLVVDGEGFTGGAIVLNQATGITGDVTVMGYDASRSETTHISSGSMSLALNADNAVANAAHVYVKDGGTLQLNGTAQSINDLQIGTGGTVAGHAALQVQGGSIAGTLYVGSITKTGSGAFTVAAGNDVAFRTLDVQGGSLVLNADMNSGGEILLHNGTSISGNGHATTAAIDVAAGQTATVTGGIILTGENVHLASGGTLEVASGTTVNLDAGAQEATQYFGGTVKLNNNSVLANATQKENLHYEFENLAISGNAQFKTAYWNSIVTVHSLTGEGQLQFQANSLHSKANKLLLDGENTFSGEVYVLRNSTGSATNRYCAVVEIAHDKALQNASLRLYGNGGNAYVAAAINTDEASMLGLDGATAGKRYAVIYAGEGLTASQSAAPASTRNATIKLTGDGTYTYYGAVSGDAEHGISLLKTGTGTQTFADGADSTASFHDVTVLGGTLNLNNTTTNVYGDYSIGQGATLSVSSGIRLEAGHMLAALQGTDTTATTATLSGTSLTLAGGTLGFSAKGLPNSTGSYMLALGNHISLDGVTGITVNFSDTGSLKEGTYKLASGNFSALGLTSDSFSTSGLGYYNAQFNLTAEGLSVTLSTAAGTLVWEGTDANHAWTASQFSGKAFSGSTTNFLFTDLAANKDVNVSANSTSSTTATFDSEGKYTVSSTGGTATVASLVKKGTGDLELQSGLAVTGSTTISEGRILLHDNALKGTITGDGTLALAFASASLSGLTGTIATLEVLENATYTLASSGNTVAAGNISINGGTVAIASGYTYADQITALSGTLGLANNAQASKLDVQGTSATVDVAAGATGKIGKATFGEDAVLTKTGSGTLSLTDKTTQGNFVVQQGTLSLDSYDYTALTGIDLRTGTKLVLASNWTSIDHAKGADMTQIKLAGGSVIEMHNGDNGTRVNADITVDATTAAAVIRGIDGKKELDRMHFEGDITGKGTLQLRALTDGTRNANSWAVNSAISNGTDGTLRLEIADVTLAIGGTSANTFSGGASVSNSDVTVNKATAFGSGKLELSNSTVTINSNLTVGALQGGADSSLAGQDGRILAFTAASGSATYSGAIGGANVSILKSGGSTQTLSNVSTLQDVAVAGGTLTLTGTQVSLAGDVAVAQGANLSLGGGITLANPISNSGTVTFADGASFSLTADNFTDDRYYITTGSGSVSGLTLDNFTISGVDNVALSALDGGDVYLYINTATGPLVWNGTAGGNTWGGTNWIAGSNTSASFTEGADVQFTAAAANKTVAVDAAGVLAGAMSITASGYTFSGGSIATTGDITVADGVTVLQSDGLKVGGNLEVGANGKFTITGGNVLDGSTLTKTGAGTLQLDSKLTAGAFDIQGGTLILNSFNYEAISSIAMGEDTKLVLNDQYTSIGADTGAPVTTISMADGAVIEMKNGGNQARVNAAITVDATDHAAVIRGVENGGNLYYAGTISGKGTLKLASIGGDGVKNNNLWTVNSTVSNGADGTLALQIADVTVALAGANTYTGGTSIANSTVTASNSAAFGTGTVALDNSTLKLGNGVNIANAVTVAAVRSGAETGSYLEVAGSDTAALSGGITGSAFSKTGSGSLTLTGADTTLTGQFGVWGGGLTISDATVTAPQLVMVDKNGGNASLTIADGGKLQITGDSVSSLVVAGWSGGTNTGTLTVEEGGQLVANDAVMQVSFWNGVTGTVNVDGGSVTAKGISFVHSQSDGTISIRRGNLTLSNGGVMTIGSEGINGVEGNDVSVTLGDGTIKASADWTMGRFTDSATLVDVTMNGTGTGTKFDTDGHNITIQNKLAGTGKLVKAGAGTLKLADVDVSAMDVQAGTLELAGAVTLHGAITSAGAVNFNGAAFTVSADDFTNNRFDVVTGTGTTTGTISMDSFTVTGDHDPLRLAGKGSSNVYLLAGAGEITWDGTNATGGDAWDNTNWLMDGSTVTFVTGDTVHFTAAAENKDVAVTTDGVTVGTMDITASGYTFSGGCITATSLTMGDGVTATFQNTVTTGGDIALNGSTLKFDTNGAYNVGMNMTGAGDVEISGSGAKTIGGKLTNVTLTMNGSDTLGFTQTLAMEGGKLVVNSGTVTVDQHNGGTSQLKKTAVEVNGGGTLVVKHDTMGWGGNGIASILLKGESEDKRAILTSDSSVSIQSMPL